MWYTAGWQLFNCVCETLFVQLSHCVTHVQTDFMMINDFNDNHINKLWKYILTHTHTLKYEKYSQMCVCVCVYIYKQLHIPKHTFTHCCFHRKSWHVLIHEYVNVCVDLWQCYCLQHRYTCNHHSHAGTKTMKLKMLCFMYRKVWQI